MRIETPRLVLQLQTLEECRAQIATMNDAERAELSPTWLALVEQATAADPWVFGFSMLRRDDDIVIGQCGFKGPADAEGVVEIAYGVNPSEQGQGYATEAATALAHFALEHDEVRLVRAHTLPNKNASTRVLTKCGFQYVGPVDDPDDGLVWRWETASATTPSTRC